MAEARRERLTGRGLGRGLVESAISFAVWAPPWPSRFSMATSAARCPALVSLSWYVMYWGCEAILRLRPMDDAAAQPLGSLHVHAMARLKTVLHGDL